MKKLTMILMAMLLGTASLWARPALSKPVDVKQPDGTVITLCLRGDEFLSFTTTIDGYTVVKGADGFYRYAEKGADGQLTATDVIARNPEARTNQDLSFLAARQKMVAPKMSEGQRQRKEMAAQMYAPAYVKSAASHRSPTSIWKRINYDNFKGLVVLVEYSDFKFKTENPREFYQKLTSEKNYTDNSKTNYPVNVEGSARDYFYDNSMGIFDPTFDVVGPVQLDMKATDVGGRDVTNETLVKMFKGALNKCNSEVDFSQYDLDNDGYIDIVYFIFAGYGSYVETNDPGYLWPHANNWTGYSSWLGMPKYDGKLFGRHACSVEIQDYESQKAQHQYLDGIGTICHEFSHVLGLADHYDADYEENGQSNDPGAYDVMAGGADFNYGLTPVGYNAFERHVLGFVEPTVLTEAGSYSLEAFATGNQAFILKTGSTDDDFYLENRQKTGWDRFLPGHGLLVWRADTSTPNVWKENKVNNDANHNYFVMVTTAPNNGKVVDLTSTTDPALVSWDGQPATMDLYDITEDGGVVTFVAGKDVYQSVIEDFEQSPVSESGATGVKGVYCTWDLNNATIEQVDGSNVVKLMRSGTLTSSAFEKGVRSLAFTVKNGSDAVKVGLKVSTDGGSFAYFKNTDDKTQVDIKKNGEASFTYRDIPANSKIQITMLSTKTSAYCYVDNLEATFYDNEIPTGIKEVQGSEVMVNGYYNLNGQRVTKPSKGLYIVNGKKAVIK